MQVFPNGALRLKWDKKRGGKYQRFSPSSIPTSFVEKHDDRSGGGSYDDDRHDEMLLLWW